MWEGGLPVEVHAETLETIAQHFQIAGAKVGLPVSSGFATIDSVMGLGGEAVGSHPVTDRAAGITAVLMSTITHAQMLYRIAEIDRRGKIKRQRSFTVKGFTAVHGGISMTRDFYVVFAPSLSLGLGSYAMGNCSVADCVSQVGCIIIQTISSERGS